MSTQPDADHFSYMDGASPVTAALAHRFLKEAFKCRYDGGMYKEEWLDEEAKSIIQIINMIQDDIYDMVLQIRKVSINDISKLTLTIVPSPTNNYFKKL